jgi:hypothetical protein
MPRHRRHCRHNVLGKVQPLASRLCLSEVKARSLSGSGRPALSKTTGFYLNLASWPQKGWWDAVFRTSSCMVRPSVVRLVDVLDLWTGNIEWGLTHHPQTHTAECPWIEESRENRSCPGPYAGEILSIWRHMPSADFGRPLHCSGSSSIVSGLYCRHQGRHSRRGRGVQLQGDAGLRLH